MGKSTRRPTRTSRIASSSRSSREKHTKQSSSEEAIKAAEQVALAAFGSGLRLAAAFGTVAAKTASVALSSLATGADKFSELVKKEATHPSGTSYPRARRSKKTRTREVSGRRRS